MKTAILIDGGYYRKVALPKFGFKDAKESADELFKYCTRHLTEGTKESKFRHELYRIFYYDCPPSDKNVYHPLFKKDISFKKTDLYTWMNDFIKELQKKRKLALRLGNISESTLRFSLKEKSLKNLINGIIEVKDLTESDFKFSATQKGVDMKIGIDIASIAYKKQVDQIVLISGDSDFVPAAKLARREGIDFILDSLGRSVKSNLFEHIDGLRFCDDRLKCKKNFAEE